MQERAYIQQWLLVTVTLLSTWAAFAYHSNWEVLTLVKMAFKAVRLSNQSCEALPTHFCFISHVTLTGVLSVYLSKWQKAECRCSIKISWVIFSLWKEASIQRQETWLEKLPTTDFSWNVSTLIFLVYITVWVVNLLSFQHSLSIIYCFNGVYLMNSIIPLGYCYHVC